MFLTLEGGEGAGKSTQLHALAERLTAAGRRVIRTREPGGTAFGEVARSILLHHAAVEGDPPFPLGETAELLVFAAARAQHIDEVIRPALDRGDAVLCDRFTDSTIAYQGYGRGIPLDQIVASIDLATRGLIPDLTVLLDLPVETGLSRRYGDLDHRLSADLFEREALAFHERVRNGFLNLAAVEPARFLVVDATLPPSAITDRIWSRVSAILRSPA